MKGKVWKYGANVDTDVIIPARYLNMTDAQDLAKHAMEDIDPSFVKEVKSGDVVIGTTNFGCGSSREHAPLVIKTCGVSCVVAKSFARIFYRNAINIGLPILECEEAVDATDAGDVLEVDLASGKITNVTKNRVFQAKPYPEFMLKIMAAGGLVNHIKASLAGS